MEILQANAVTLAVRNSVQGRVLLTGDYEGGVDTDILVGQTADIYGGSGNSGAVLFLNNTVAATLVQPNAANTGIEHSEDVTLDAPAVGDLHLSVSAAATNDYTTARGAYIVPQTLPSVVSDIEFVAQDISLLQPDAIEFPESSMLVELLNVDLEEHDHPQYRMTYNFRLKYFRTRLESENNSVAFYGALDSIANMLVENYTLGGWVDDSNITDVRRIPDDDRNAIYPYDFAYITIVAQVDRTYSKTFTS